MLGKTTFREIKSSLSRYFAILIIIALGVGFFGGLKVTKEAMINTLNSYVSDSVLYDYSLSSSLGFDEKSVEEFSQLSNVIVAEGSMSFDVLCRSTGSGVVMKAHSIPHDLNKLNLISGNMPTSSNECVADGRRYSEDDIGSTITLSNDNDKDTLNKFSYKEYTITGLVLSPTYLNYERGSTSIGGGVVLGYFYIPEDGFKTDIYTQIYLKLSGDEAIYSDEYNDKISDSKDDVTEVAKTAAYQRYNSIKEKANKKLLKAKKDYKKGYNEYLTEKENAYSRLNDAKNKLENKEKKIAASEKKLQSTLSALKASKSKIALALKGLSQKEKDLEASKQYMPESEYAKAKAKLQGTKTKLQSSLSQTKAGIIKVQKNQKKLSDGKAKIAAGWDEYYSNLSEVNDSFATAKQELNEAKEKINKAQKKVNSISRPDVYVFTRDINVGYVCFENDAEIINQIAKVFPLFFFLVAALVCITTMTRMIDEQRTQIGVMKALGYSSRAVMFKYLFYSGSAAFLGTAIGYFSSSLAFPIIIWNAYGIMYDFGCDLIPQFDVPLGIISLIAALFCSMGACLVSGLKDFKNSPSQLIRPKSPPKGKRILLEKFTLLWNKISFLYKVTLRNIFRYKKRFFMMILGISGCTALLVTGFGINDTIKNIASFQYNEVIKYDYSVFFEEGQSKDAQEDFRSQASPYIKDSMFVDESDIFYSSKNKKEKLTLIVSQDKDFASFINLHTSLKPVDFPSENEAVICEKLAEKYNIKSGEKIHLKREDGKKASLVVSDICKNYVNNYVYISDKTYRNAWSDDPVYDIAYVIAKEKSAKGVHASVANVSDLDYVMGASVCIDLEDRISNMMDSLNAVIVLIVFAAGALAFIVLYNLTNINITERIREIATIKVLGFYPRETSAYVFRENFILTGISAFVGLFLGKALLEFVIKQIDVALIHFDTRVTFFSYCLAVLLTFVFAVIVNLVMYYRIKKINMVESLKSVE